MVELPTCSEAQVILPEPVTVVVKLPPLSGFCVITPLTVNVIPEFTVSVMFWVVPNRTEAQLSDAVTVG